MREGKKRQTLSSTVSVLLVAFESFDQVSKVHSFCESGQESEDLSETMLLDEFLDITAGMGYRSVHLIMIQLGWLILQRGRKG